MTYLLEVTVEIDDDEISLEKVKEIRRAIESLDPSVGVFLVENITEFHEHD